MADRILLVGDIGGTNARFALANGNTGYHSERVFTCADFPTPEEPIRVYLEELGGLLPEVVCIAAAGPIIDGCCKLTNSPWEISTALLSAAFNPRRVLLVNDFAAVAFGLPALSAGCVQVGPVPAARLDRGDFTVGVLGPGTGLGVAGLLRRGDLVTPLVTEAGHIGFAPETALQSAVLACMRSRFERISIERIISGPGIVNLHTALAEVGGHAKETVTAADIFAHSQDEPGSLARQCTDLFFEIFGQVAGDLALAFGAEQGMFIAGGIVRRYPRMLEASQFRAGFEKKGRHRALMQRIPTMLIEHPHPGLIGAADRARTVVRNMPQ